MDVEEITSAADASRVMVDVIGTSTCQYQWPDQTPAMIPAIGPELLKRGARIFAARNEAGEWQGVLSGAIFTDFHTGYLTGFGQMFIVRPGNGMLFDELFTAWERACKAAGCRRITMGLLLGATGSDDKVRQMYQWFGMEKVSEAYSKKLEAPALELKS